MRALDRQYLIIYFLCVIFLSSCSKDGGSYLDDTSSFPFGWKVDQMSNIIGTNSFDSIRAIRNTSVTAFGTSVDNSYGTFRASFFASYQTTLTSKSFNFSSIDSIVLILPYFASNSQYGGLNRPMSIEVYEMTESIDTDPNSKKKTYAYSTSVIGSKLNFVPAPKDSVIEGTRNVAPSIRIPLNSALAARLVAPGSYANDADFQAIFKGLYVRSSANTSTNGFVMLSLGSDNVIRIYGKNTSGTEVTADFSTGGSSSTTISEYIHDHTSLAYSASFNSNSATGDNILYSHGLNGYVPTIRIPDIKSYAKNKSIFKAELSIYSIDTGLFTTSSLGLMYLDTNKLEFVLPDELYKKGYEISTKDTLIGGQSCREYKFNIAMYLNRWINSNNMTGSIRVYSAPLIINSGVTKFSDFLPTRTIIGGTGHLAQPSLKIYYTEI